tara:strand:+ start:100 stop:732 length:633 start_codon:yes stop_codon:yes gene_type:complete
LKTRLLITPLLIALVGCASSYKSERKPLRFDPISAEVLCKSTIKKLLRDPDSYKFEKASMLESSGEYNQFGKALISFRSKNGFGGYTPALAECTRFEKEGKNVVLVKLLDQTATNKLIDSYTGVSSKTQFEVNWDTRDTYTNKNLELITSKSAVCDRPPLGGTNGKGTIKFEGTTQAVSVEIIPCVAEPIKEPVVKMSDGRVLYLVQKNN